MPMLRKKSNVAIHFYKTGAVRLLQKTKVKAKSGRGRPKSVRQIVLLDVEDVSALADVVAEAQRQAAADRIKAKEKADKAAAKKAAKKAERAAKDLLTPPANVPLTGGETAAPPTTPAPAVADPIAAITQAPAVAPQATIDDNVGPSPAHEPAETVAG